MENFQLFPATLIITNSQKKLRTPPRQQKKMLHTIFFFFMLHVFSPKKQHKKIKTKHYYDVVTSLESNKKNSYRFLLIIHFNWIWIFKFFFYYHFKYFKFCWKIFKLKLFLCFKSVGNFIWRSLTFNLISLMVLWGFLNVGFCL